MKGLEKPVHVVAVRSEERDDALAIAPFVRSIAYLAAGVCRAAAFLLVVAAAAPVALGTLASLLRRRRD